MYEVYTYIGKPLEFVEIKQAESELFTTKY